MSSTGLSKLFEKLMHQNLKICFVIGGSFGLSEILKQNLIKCYQHQILHFLIGFLE